MALDRDNFDLFGNDMIQVTCYVCTGITIYLSVFGVRHVCGTPLYSVSLTNGVGQCFYDVSTVTGEPIRSKTLKYVEHLANRYLWWPVVVALGTY